MWTISFDARVSAGDGRGSRMACRQARYFWHPHVILTRVTLVCMFCYCVSWQYRRVGV